MDKSCVEELVRNVSKTGSFELAPRSLTLAQLSLSGDEVVELYGVIRDQSRRLEAEWRDEFEVTFSEFVSALPPVGHPDASWRGQ